MKIHISANPVKRHNFMIGWQKPKVLKKYTLSNPVEKLQERRNIVLI